MRGLGYEDGLRIRWIISVSSTRCVATKTSSLMSLFFNCHKVPVTLSDETVHKTIDLRRPEDLTNAG